MIDILMKSIIMIYSIYFYKVRKFDRFVLGNELRVLIFVSIFEINFCERYIIMSKSALKKTIICLGLCASALLNSAQAMEESQTFRLDSRVYQDNWGDLEYYHQGGGLDLESTQTIEKADPFLTSTSFDISYDQCRVTLTKSSSEKAGNCIKLHFSTPSPQAQDPNTNNLIRFVLKGGIVQVKPKLSPILKQIIFDNSYFLVIEK